MQDATMLTGIILFVILEWVAVWFRYKGMVRYYEKKREDRHKRVGREQ
jgi:hypothetical protein